jgi:hypothetical protein
METQRQSLEHSPCRQTDAFSKSKDSYVDLTVVSGFGQCVLIMTGLVMLGLAIAVFG